MGVYLLNLLTVLKLYQTSDKSPPVWIWPILILSKRIHSIFILRMFNDCIAVWIGYIAILCFMKYNWRIGCILYSLSVSVKMNMLLYAPGLLLVLLISCGIHETIICLTICAVIQVIVGYPFLSTHPVSYISRSFDLGREFLYEWTVNFKCVPESVFTHKLFSIALLLATIIGMCIYE